MTKNIYTTVDDAMVDQVITPLGEWADQYDVGAIADEILEWDPAEDEQGVQHLNHQGFRVKEDYSDDTQEGVAAFWEVVKRHEKTRRLHWSEIREDEDGQTWATVTLEYYDSDDDEWYAVQTDPARVEATLDDGWQIGAEDTEAQAEIEDTEIWEAAEDRLLAKAGLTRDDIYVQNDGA